MPSEQDIWDAYRQDPEHRPHLQTGGVGGSGDLEAAMRSKVILNEDDPEDIEMSGPLYLGDYVLHTLTAYAARRGG